MFVRDFIHIGHSFEVVAPRFIADTTWLVPLAEKAADEAHDVATSLLGSTARPPDTGLRHPVRCELGPVRVRAASLVIPLWLHTQGPKGVLPDLTGDLEVAPVGSNRVLLELGATYPRPARDPVVRQRIERATEAGVRMFLAGIAAELG